MQTQGEFELHKEGATKYNGLIDALTKVFRQEGMRGLTRGIWARVAFHSMSAALAWTTYVKLSDRSMNNGSHRRYEQVKHLMAKMVR